MYLNKVFIFGNLTRDPELRSMPTGNKVASFGVATNRTWRDKEGAQKEQVEFHNVVVFGRTAENIAQYLRKGSSILVEGRIQTRSWEKEGAKQYRTEIVADRVQFGPKSSNSGSSGMSSDGPKASKSSKSGKAEAAPAELDTIEYPEEDINAEDIPF
jgi:single-strand DNA-binding protein